MKSSASEPGLTGISIACSWLASKKSISEKEQPGDSGDFLHEVVFFIDRHSCVACSTGKVPRGKFQNKIRTKPYKLQALARLQETNDVPWIFKADLSKVLWIFNFIADTRCTTFTFHTFAHNL